jgi:hypothetical protein
MGSGTGERRLLRFQGRLARPAGGWPYSRAPGRQLAVAARCDSSTPDKLFVVGQAVWRRSLLAFGLMLAWFFGRYLIIFIANT